MFKTETGFNISTIEDGTIIFYKKSEMYATVFYLGGTSLLLCRSDMTSMSIPLAKADDTISVDIRSYW